MKTGVFHHPFYGPFKIDSTVFDSMVKNFSGNVRQIDLAVDYEHNNQSIAAGWITGLKKKQGENGDQLWAEMDWTPRGRQVLSDKEFRYVSAEFDLEYQDSETLSEHGPTLFGAGLTNRPFLKGMAATTQLDEGEFDMNLKELQEQLDAAKIKLTEQTAEIKKLTDAIEESKKLSERVTALETENTTLKTAAETAAQEKAKLEKKTKFDKMLSDGKACEAQREAFMSDDLAKFAELQQPVKLSTAGTGDAGEGSKTVTNKADAEAEIDRLAKELVTGKKCSDYGSAVKKVLAENAELKKLYEARE
jgi:phage I-like protein